MSNSISIITSLSTAARNLYEILRDSRNEARKQNNLLTDIQIKRIEEAIKRLIAIERQNTISYLYINKYNCLSSLIQQFKRYKNEPFLLKCILCDMEKAARDFDRVIADYIRQTSPVIPNKLPSCL